MIIKVNDIEQTLVQVTNSSTDESVGLYLVPNGVSIDEFEKELSESINQDIFDENNTLGVQRVFAYDSILNLHF